MRTAPPALIRWFFEKFKALPFGSPSAVSRLATLSHGRYYDKYIKLSSTTSQEQNAAVRAR
jgi:hypothetical protein